MAIPEYVKARIRRDYPANCHVVHGTTPVVSFGDFQSAWVATLGLNPSDKEFRSGGRWLEGSDQRLETLESLGLTSLSEATDAQVKQIVRACARYFHRNPYSWFDTLDKLLAESLGVTYASGNAVHLDLVQWATDPVWGQIKSDYVKARLIEQDRDFLRAQLSHEGIRLVLLNGRSVMDQVTDMGIPLRHHCRLVGSKSDKDEVRVAVHQDTTYIGWNRYVPTGAMSKAQRSQVAETIADWQSLSLWAHAASPKSAPGRRRSDC
jgi:hypothetical protein